MISRSAAFILYAFIFLTGVVVFSPTIAYLAAAPFVFDFLSHDTPSRALVGKLLYVGVPLVGWAVARTLAERRIRAFQAKIAGIPLQRLDGPVPRDVVLEGSGGHVAFNFHKVAGIERIYEPIGGGEGAWNLIDLTKKTRFIERTKVHDVPLRHLLLRLDRASRFFDGKLQRKVGGGPFELTIVEDGNERLLGLFYEPLIRKPIFPPLLTLHGWFSKPNTMNTDQIRARIELFLADTLSASAPATSAIA
jgi:hypothetical protein